MWRIIDTMQEFIDRQTGVRSIMCEIAADTAADLPANTADRVFILGTFATAIDTGDIYKINSAGAWILQPSQNAFSNVYTKSEIDGMITEIYDVIAYYHTTLISDTGEITFYSLGGNVGTWAIYGNGQQTGTPTPDNPIMPEFVGVRTANLWNYTIEQGGWLAAAGSIPKKAVPYDIGYTSRCRVADIMPIPSNTMSVTCQIGIKINFVWVDTNGVSMGGSGWQQNGSTVTAPDNAVSLTFILAKVDDSICSPNDFKNIMLNSGSTALPYEPYGYKIPISCAGQTNNVYMSAPLRKAIDGTDAVDMLDSTGTITRNVDENGDDLGTPTTETIDVPEIPTVNGNNTLTVDTILKPSRIEIQG